MKKEPQRMCVVCRQMFAKSELIRVVKDQNGEYSLDAGGKKNGRGAYICKACSERCVDKKLLNKILKTKLDDSFYGQIDEYAKRK